MPDRPAPDAARRRLIRALLAAPAIATAAPLLGLVGCGRAAPGHAATLTPTPTCDDGDDPEPTPRQTAGPFYTPDSPQRASLLEAGLAGIPIVLTGRVLDTTCTPVPGALLDFWHADDAGAYDNDGYRCRGHQFADAEGRYRLETIVPGRYPGRTLHYHVRVQAPDRDILTTQLYFPGEPLNARDGLYRAECLMALTETEGGPAAAFDFVLDLG